MLDAGADRVERPEGGNETMTMRVSGGIRAMVALVLFAVLAAGCSSSEGGASSDQTISESSSTSTTTTTSSDGAVASAPVASQPRPSCSAATLAPVSGTPDAALVDVVCETDDAAATLTNGPDGETVLVFSLTNGVWALVGTAPAAGGAAAAVPAGVSATVIPAWSRVRDARIARAGAPKEGLYPTAEDPLRGCRAEGDGWVCPQAPVTVPPDDPDAPPTSLEYSNFCKFNYNDTRCVETNQQYQPQRDG